MRRDHEFMMEARSSKLSRLFSFSILVNASSELKLIQFGKVFWDPGESAERVLPCASVEAGHTDSPARMTGRKKEARAKLLHLRSTPTRGESHSRDAIQVQQEREAFLVSASARGCETDTRTLTLSERAAGERIKKRGLHHPLTRDSLLLRVGALQRARSGDEAGVNMQRNAALRDSWGPQDGASCEATPAPQAPGPDSSSEQLRRVVHKVSTRGQCCSWTRTQTSSDLNQ